MGMPGKLHPSAEETERLVEECCMLIADALRCGGLTVLPGCDLQQLGLDIQSHIVDERLRRLPVLLG